MDMKFQWDTDVSGIFSIFFWSLCLNLNLIYWKYAKYPTDYLLRNYPALIMNANWGFLLNFKNLKCFIVSRAGANPEIFQLGVLNFLYTRKIPTKIAKKGRIDPQNSSLNTPLVVSSLLQIINLHENLIIFKTSTVGDLRISNGKHKIEFYITNSKLNTNHKTHLYFLFICGNTNALDKKKSLKCSHHLILE